MGTKERHLSPGNIQISPGPTLPATRGFPFAVAERGARLLQAVSVSPAGCL